MMRRVLPLILLLILGCQPKVYPQQFKSFSKEPAVFIKEFQQYIQGASQKSLNETFLKFKKLWDELKYTESQQKNIIKLCNNMLEQQLPIQPYFELLIGNLISYNENGLIEDILVQWQDIANKLLDKAPKEYLAFLETCNLLFGKNTLLEDESKKWYSNNNKFEISFDKNEVAINFENLQLTGETAGDKIVISNTSGVYYPGRTLWVSKGGTTNWERVGLGADEISVKLPAYKIDFSKTEYHSDSATLTFPKYYSGEILGSFSDKMSNSSDPETAKKSSYPKFTTYRNDLEIKGLLGPSATYTGGLLISGAEINGQASAGNDAIVTIKFKDKPKVIAKSKSFKIINGAIQSLESSFEIVGDSGNIYHPKVIFNFNFKDGMMLVSKGDKGMMQAMFSDAFHKLDFDVQRISWKISEPFIDLRMSNPKEEAKFQSNGFFRDFIYERIQGMLAYNPLELLRDYSIKVVRGPKFTLADFAAYRSNTKANVQEMIYNVADGGYIYYNPQNDTITIKPKLHDYVLAHNKVKDYDVIRFSSMIEKRPNATLNLITNDLKVEGVQKFGFSDSQNVIALPTEQIITVGKNRKIKFGGMIRAGRFDFFGKQFNFDYEQFKILYSNIDSMRLYFPDSSGRALVPIKSVLRNIYGTLLIDKPTNKSGLANYPEYPIFISDKGSEIKYDKPSIHNGAYKNDNFKFEVDPFTIDSLDNFTLSGLQFDGTFKSDGIFPDFRHKASIQKDYSLGFVTRTPPGGYEMYRGKGKGEMVISLSEQGLYGSGEIKYLGAKVTSDKFLLLPKQMMAVTNFDLPESALYPEVHGKATNTVWSPYDSKMDVAKGSENFKVFKMGYDFDGAISLTPANVHGNGTLKWSEATFASKDMILGKNKADAQSATLNIFAADPAKIAFQSADVKGTLDFDKREGKFTSNATGSLTQFPANMYATNLNDYKWNMDAKTIEVKTSPTMVGSPYFISTKPSQDSLQFEAKKAVYSITSGLLKIEMVPYIDVADSRVFLKDGKVTIKEDAYMFPLDSSKIMANRTDQFHNVYGCTTNIYGKYAMKAKGKYQYVSKLGQKQEMLLDSIFVTRERLVQGIGFIDESQQFTLDTKIGYKGYAQIMSNEKFVQFTGFVKPNHTFDFIPNSIWFRYKDKVDPKNVVVNVSDPRDKDNKRMFTGVFFANDSSHVYPLLFAQKRRYSDPEITIDTGVLVYDQATSSFKVGDEGKILKGELKGNYIQFNEKDHSVYAEGALDMGFENKDFKFLTAGSAALKPGDSAFSFEVAFIMDFPLPKEFTDQLATMAKAEGAGAGSVNNNNEFVKKAFGEMITNKVAGKAIAKGIEKNGQIEARDEANAKLVMSHAEFVWDQTKRGLANSSPVDIAIIGGTQINKKFKSNIMIEHRRSGENLYIYLEINDQDWVFFNCVRNTMYIVSNVQKLNDVIINQGEKVSTDNFNLRVGTLSMKDKFLRKFE